MSDSFKSRGGFSVIFTSPLGAQYTSAIKWSATLLYKQTWRLLTGDSGSSENVVNHSENCKVEIPLDTTARQLS